MSATTPDRGTERASSERLARRSGRELRLIQSTVQAVALVLVLAAYLVLPLVVSDLWANVFVLAGILAIGGLGLNLLTGFAGQASLGHAAFIAIGAFTGSYLGRSADFGGKGQPFLVYLVVAMIAGGLVGFVVGLPALRLRGPYLVIVTLGLVFATVYVLQQWTTVSNGNAGAPAPVTLQIGSVDFKSFDLFGLRDTPLGKNQGMMYIVWAFVALTALVVKNIVRSRPGRALQAIRDRDVAAEVVGISLFRYKVGAFVASSAIAAGAGAFYCHYLGYVKPDPLQFGLALSVTFLAVMIVGGIGTVYGTMIGAVIIGALPVLVHEYGTNLPLVDAQTVGAFSDIVVAAVLVLTLLTQPSGIAGTLHKLGGGRSRAKPAPEPAT
ncbi:MAG: branched-chain amino acid ABC transporter permease [Acidimicrobiia bacterium]